MSLVKRFGHGLSWLILSLVFTVFAVPVWGQSSAIVGEVDAGVNANAEFVLRFVTNKASMSRIEYGFDDELVYQTDVLIALSGVHEHVLRDVQPGTVYSYRIHIYDWSGWEEWTDVKTFVVPEVRPPTGLRARAGKLTWDKSFGAVEYMVQRSERSGGPYETIGIVSETQFVDEDVDEDTEYYYVVYALDKDGNAYGPSEELAAVMVERYYVELGANPVNVGLSHVDWEDGLSEAVVVDGRGALRLVPNPLTPPRYLYFDVDDDLFFNTDVTVEIIVEYRSESSGSFSLHYDAVDLTSGPLDGAYAPAIVTGSTSGSVQVSPSDEWKQARFTLSHARFAGRQNGGTDFRLAGSEGLDLIVARIEMVVKEIFE